MLHHKSNTYIKSSIFFSIRVFAPDIIIILSFYHKKLLCKYILYFFHNIFILSLYFDNSLMFSHFCVYQHTILIRTQKYKAATVTKHLQQPKRRKGVFNLYENV